MKRHAAAVVCFFLVFSQVTLASEFRFSRRPNTAHLIPWKQWDGESLQRAKKDEKPILLSLSAVWCHWCHVMDETTYSDNEVQAYIRSHFVPIRVDADMRPDIDALYNQGGWPSTVVLTPGGEIIYGGTYLPPEQMLIQLKKAYELFAKDRQKLENALDMIGKRKGTQTEDVATPGYSDVAKIMEMVHSAFDGKHGGFGGPQKFPNADAIDFVLSGYSRTKDPDLGTIIALTLNRMAEGEIYDAVEGGFFRYATRPDWSSPHYEKMLGLNAGLIRNYAEASLVSINEVFGRVVRESIGYLKRSLRDPETGAFFGSQDADEEYYKSRNRKGLQAPPIDRTVYADSNAGTISALVAAYNATGDREYLGIARKTEEFMEKNLFTREKGVYHYFRDGGKYLPGLLSDNALFGLALIDLYNTTGDREYMKLAGNIASFVAGRFYDGESRQFMSSLGDTIIRPSVSGVLLDYNVAQANYHAILFLGRFRGFTRDEKLKEMLFATAARFRGVYERFGPVAPLYGEALRWIVGEPVEVTIIADGATLDAFLSEVNGVYIPGKVVRVFSPREDGDKIKEHGYPVKEAVYLCAGKKCARPFENPRTMAGGMYAFLDTLRKGE